MADNMKAFVMKKIGEVGFMEKPLPVPGPNDAIIKTTVALVCTSDVHTVKGAIGERTDQTLGHEACGIVEEVDAVEEILKLTDNEGVDSAMEAVGAQIPLECCIKVTRPGGTISNLGYHGEGEYLQIPRLEWGVGMAEKTIKTLLCPGGSERMARMLRLIETGRVDPTKMSTHHFNFDELDKAFWMMDSKEDNIIKPVIHVA